MMEFHCPNKKPDSYEEVVALVDKFTNVYPWAAYSFGHIVLDDYNLENHFIEWCLEDDQVTKWLNHEVDNSILSQWGFTHGRGQALDRAIKRKDIVKQFLRYLLTVPEDCRIEWIEIDD